MAPGLERLRKAILFLGAGGGLGLLIAVVGAGLATLADAFAGVSFAASGGPIPLALAIPFALLDALGLWLLITNARRLHKGLIAGSYSLVVSSRRRFVAIYVVLGLAVTIGGYLGLATPLGIMDIRTGGGAIGLLAAWIAQIPPMVGSVKAFMLLQQALRLTNPQLSPDLKWWWDGATWRSIKGERDATSVAREVPKSIHRLAADARIATTTSLVSLGTGIVLAAAAGVGGVVTGSDEVLLIFSAPGLLLAAGTATLLAISRWRLRGIREDRAALARSRGWLSVSRIALWVCVPVNGYAALALAFGVLFSTTRGEAILTGVDDAGSWLVLVTTFIALYFIYRAVRLVKLKVSDDGRWWWNEDAWQPFADAQLTAPIPGS